MEYPAKRNDEALKKTRRHIFATFPSFHFIPSPGTRVPMTMGKALVGQSLE
jgi:hypothetical protein